MRAASMTSTADAVSRQPCDLVRAHRKPLPARALAGRLRIGESISERVRARPGRRVRSAVLAGVEGEAGPLGAVRRSRARRRARRTRPGAREGGRRPRRGSPGAAERTSIRAQSASTRAPPSEAALDLRLCAARRNVSASPAAAERSISSIRGGVSRRKMARSEARKPSSPGRLEASERLERSRDEDGESADGGPGAAVLRGARRRAAASSSIRTGLER